MASVKHLKKNINHVLGDIIEECYMWELMNPKESTKKSEAIIDEAIAVFDELIAELHIKNIENKKAHYKSVSLTLEKKAKDLVAKVNAL
ncbi:MAG: hypothetical protein GKR88_11590 [Flavobacteriaceae bacterium]|nr:MAG: hypothetical protein GKR88_11590 [Flavobacteriaceae bacterium]